MNGTTTMTVPNLPLTSSKTVTFDFNLESMLGSLDPIDSLHVVGHTKWAIGLYLHPLLFGTAIERDKILSSRARRSPKNNHQKCFY